MCSNLALNKYLHSVATWWILFNLELCCTEPLIENLYRVFLYCMSYCDDVQEEILVFSHLCDLPFYSKVNTHLQPTNKVKNKWICTSIPPHGFMAWVWKTLPLYVVT